MKSAAVHFKSGDVLYGRLRPYLNKVYRPNFEGLCSAEFIVFPEGARVHGSYLQYFLNSASFTNFASHLNAGDRPRVDFEQMLRIRSPCDRSMTNSTGSSPKSKSSSPASMKPSPTFNASKPTSNATKPPSSKPPSKAASW